MGEPIRALIVDDEAPGRINLRLALRNVPGWSVAGECGSVAQARAFLRQQPVDAIFLDIQMPEETGVELARELSREETPPVIIFVTAYDEFALEAFEVHALDYLLKPFDDARFLRATAYAESMVRSRQPGAYGAVLRDYLDQVDASATPIPEKHLARFVVRSTGTVEFIPTTEVAWIGSAGNYVELHTAHRTVLHRATIGSVEHLLDPADFVRVHRTAIVRRDGIAALSVTGDGTYALDLRSGAQVPVSQRYLKGLRALLGVAEPRA